MSRLKLKVIHWIISYAFTYKKIFLKRKREQKCLSYKNFKSSERRLGKILWKIYKERYKQKIKSEEMRLWLESEWETREKEEEVIVSISPENGILI